jgi:hypothetical protein
VNAASLPVRASETVPVTSRMGRSIRWRRPWLGPCERSSEGSRRPPPTANQSAYGFGALMVSVGTCRSKQRTAKTLSKFRHQDIPGVNECNSWESRSGACHQEQAYTRDARPPPRRHRPGEGPPAQAAYPSYATGAEGQPSCPSERHQSPHLAGGADCCPKLWSRIRRAALHRRREQGSVRLRVCRGVSDQGVPVDCSAICLPEA